MSSQPLPGFRDFFPDDCARRNYLFAMWREVARRYGFVEYDGPTVEPLSLYEKKSGGELVGQLFTVGVIAGKNAGESADASGIKGALRPEMTPTLARMVAARERDFKKPLKWFCMPSFFRHERQQRGRLREFYQLNCDIIGENSVAADAELIALAIDTLQSFGLTEKDFVVRLSSRDVWTVDFLNQKFGTITTAAQRENEFFQVLDRIEKQDALKTDTQLREFNSSLEDVQNYITQAKEKFYGPDVDMVGKDARLGELQRCYRELKSRGLAEFVELDLMIVRGLAYYTGVVFEVFDRSKKERALAGGGRYDHLLSLISDKRVSMPALGFGMGDVVLGNLIDDTPHAAEKMRAWIAKHHAADIYVVIAKEERRADALAIVQQLRDAGYRTDFPLAPAKVGKQFQTAEQLGARISILVGDELESGNLKIKTLATRDERLVPCESLIDRVAQIFNLKSEI